MASFSTSTSTSTSKSRKRDDDLFDSSSEEKRRIIVIPPDFDLDITPRLTIASFRGQQDATRLLPFDDAFQLYRDYFSLQFEGVLKTNLHSLIQNNSTYITSLDLQKKTYYHQLQEQKAIQNPRFIELYKKYSLLIDYVDMVHDITKCFDFLLKVLKVNDNDSFILLKKLIEDLCGGSFYNIRIKRSHEIQRRLLNEYIDELRLMGFLISYVEDPVAITSVNATTMANDIKICARESGRYFVNFLTSAGMSTNGFVAVKQNALGAIDGCKGECEIVEQIIWEYVVAGVFHLYIKTDGHKSDIRVTLYGLFYDFSVTGEIVLDDIIQLLDSSRIPFRREGGVRVNNITPFPGFSSNDPLHCAALISLKTICDKRLVQRMQTDYKDSPNRFDAFTTTDKYVPAGTVLAYLGGQIPYCPSVLLTREDGYDRYDFEKSDNLQFELTERYSLYLEYLKYFAPKYPDIFPSPPGYLHEAVPFMLKAFDFTTLFLLDIRSKISDPDYGFNSFWEYIYLNAIANQIGEWTNKLKDLMHKIKTVFDLLSSQQYGPSLINALLSIPTVIPSISEFIGELEDEEDVIDLLGSRISMGELYGSFFTRPNFNQTIWDTAFPNPANWNQIDPKTIAKFIKDNNLKPKYTDTDFLPTEFTRPSSRYPQNGNITIEGDYLIIYYKGTEEGLAKNFANNYKLNDDDDYLELIVEKPLAQLTETKCKVKLPITADLLINVAFHLNAIGRRPNPDEARRVCRLLGDKLFDRVGSWIGFVEENRVEFVTFFVNCALYAGANTKYNNIWNQLQPGYDETAGFEIVGPRRRGGNKTIKKYKGKFSVKTRIKKNKVTKRNKPMKNNNKKPRKSKKQNRKTRKKSISRKDIEKTD